MFILIKEIFLNILGEYHYYVYTVKNPHNPIDLIVF